MADAKEKVVALVDGSAYSRVTCEYAGWIAARTGRPVEAVHVIGRPDRSSEKADLSGSLQLGARSALLEDLARLDAERARLSQALGREILADAMEVLEAAGAQDVSVRLRIGDLADGLADIERGAAMLVMGKRGETADAARQHLGSHFERAVRASRLPVFVASRPFREIRSIMIAFDGGPSTQQAVERVADSPLYDGLSVRLVTVGAEDSASAAAFEAARERLQAAGREVSAERLQGAPETAIAEAVDREGVDLLVMGAYGHSRIRTLLIGSTTTAVIRACKVPVVLFR